MQIHAPSSEAIDRAIELAKRWINLKRWGASSKLPHTKETQADLDRFVEAMRRGELDPSEIVAVTSDVRRLEKYAEEYDASRNIKPGFRREALRTTFDIERGDEGNVIAKKIVDASDDAKSFAKDAVKEGAQSLAESANVIPWWAWGAAGTALAVFVLSQLATVARAFGRGR